MHSRRAGDCVTGSRRAWRVHTEEPGAGQRTRRAARGICHRQRLRAAREAAGLGWCMGADAHGEARPGSRRAACSTEAHAGIREAVRGIHEKNKTTPGINFVSDVANCVPPGVAGQHAAALSAGVPVHAGPGDDPHRNLLAGSPHLHRWQRVPKEPDATYQGTSVGKWEGDTLVVETIGNPARDEPDERHQRPQRQDEDHRAHPPREPDVLEISTTREDPAVFVEPHTTTARYQRHRDWKIMEYVCAQNNRDQLDEKGNPGFNLERKPGE